MSSAIIQYLRKRENNWKCAFCNELVDRRDKHIILEVHTIPPFLFIFHVKHYEDFVETLENIFIGIDNNKLEKFLEKSIYEIEEERSIAKSQGFENEFEEDMDALLNYTFFKVIKETVKSKFNCDLTKEEITIKNCFLCNIEKFMICTKKIFFSVRPKDQRLQTKRGY